MNTNCICNHTQQRHAAMGCKDCPCVMFLANVPGTMRGREAWLLKGDELIHGTIYGQDVANGLLHLEADGGGVFTLPNEAFAFTPAQVKQRIAATVRRLARLAAEFDQTIYG